ncbi:O-fucosyltransferase family protein [Saccharicrinis fermentans]|uniref:hypothetical protein n=1 Tax=Saccharicrinis fermentans TaxID=982 RepID=UPI00048A00B2|nr:hypothetical protein [Saccharicrinis fermentans]
MISIVPGGGLANRMRAIDSAIALTRNTVKIIWLKNKDLNCDFYQLFKPHHLFRVVDFNYSKFYAYPNYLFCRAKKLKYLQEIVRKFLFNQVFTNPDIEEINSKGGSGIKNLKSNKMFIETCERFDNTKKMHEIFIPTDAIQSRVDSIINNNHNFIGIHIRRTDNIYAIIESPLSLYLEAIEKQLALDPNVKFFLATDDKDIKKELLEKYPKHIFTNETPLSRNSAEGIKGALVDFLCLSNAKLIIGSSSSSFSSEAANYGNIDLTILKK